MTVVMVVDPSTIQAVFGVVSITGPIFGVVIGGNLTTYLGGYNAERALKGVCAGALLCLVVAAPIPFFDDFVPVIVLLWFLLFFGGAILPAMTGIMLNCVKKE